MFPITVFENERPILIPDNEAFRSFVEKYCVIEAAGGIVTDCNRNVLMIHRLDKWDFPKGKIERGESTSDAALREVMEETNVSGIDIIKPLYNTYHTYKLNDTDVLKITHWFHMICPNSGNLKPQIEEDIDDVVWVDWNKVGEKLEDSYASLKDLWNKINAQC